MEDDPTLKEFFNKNEFCGYFRFSSKTGFNVSESMKNLIRIIIKRIIFNLSEFKFLFLIEKVLL